MNLEFFFQLYICFDTFAPLPEQYSNIHVSFYFWLINKDHKSYFNVSTVRAWDRKDANKLWLSTHIISFLPFEFNHKGAYNLHWVLPTEANHYIIINTISVHCKSVIISLKIQQSVEWMENSLLRLIQPTKCWLEYN